MTCPRCEGTDWKDGPGGSRECAGCGWLMWTSGVETSSTPLTEDAIRATIEESRDVAVGSNVPPPTPTTPTTMAGDEPTLLPIVLPEISGPSEPVPAEVRELAAEIEGRVLYGKAPTRRRRRPRAPLSREQRSTLAALRNVHRRHETTAAERARLAAECRERGLTWKQIADACGVTHPTAIRWSRNAGP